MVYAQSAAAETRIYSFDVFLSLPWLQEQLQLVGRANVLLAGNGGQTDGLVDRANEVLRREWTLADAELRFRDLEGSGLFELTSDRVFIEQPVVDAVARIQPALVGVLAYFVNELRHGDRATPYSMVAAIGPLSPNLEPTDPSVADALGILPENLGGDGIVLNEWLAADLQAEIGDRVEVAYFVMGSQLRLLWIRRTVLRLVSYIKPRPVAREPLSIPARFIATVPGH